jgi:hypothetical protein
MGKQLPNVTQGHFIPNQRFPSLACYIFMSTKFQILPMIEKWDILVLYASEEIGGMLFQFVAGAKSL